MLSVLVVFGLLAYAHGLPGGAPLAACISMTPDPRPTKHNNTPSTAISPYNVSVGMLSLESGNIQTVTLDGNGTFKGILLEARAIGQNDAAVGSWFVPADSNDYQTINCSSPTGALTHKNANNKTLPQEFTWSAPDVNQPTNFIIYATVVMELRTFWVKLPTGNFTVMPRVVTTTLPEVTTTTPPAQEVENTTDSGNALQLSYALFCLVMLGALSRMLEATSTLF
uniref:Reelin domain-containing protein n=1 Tax=Ciona savignyi TaxID=51511 RepID=H2ZHI4_CIOSA